MAASRAGVVSAEEKQLLLERYLDIEWIDDITESKCVRCDRVPIHHYVSNCQHMFCRNCRTVFSDGGRWRCPQCREFVTELSDQDWQLEDTIYQIRAHCPNKKYGCPYQGQLKTIPGHLRHCADTREAALPAEFKGITLDTVVDQILRLEEEMRSEMRDIKDKCEGNCKRTKEMEEKLLMIKQCECVPNENLAHVEQLLKDVKELRDECESNRGNIKKNNDRVALDIKLFRWDLHEQKEQLDIVKPLLRDVKELKDESEANCKHRETMVNELTTSIQVLNQGLNEQKHQLAKVEQTLPDVQDKYEIQQQYIKTMADELTNNSNAMERNVNAHVQELRSQLEIHETLVNAKITQTTNQLKMNVDKTQTIVTELKEDLETKWKDMKINIDYFNKDLKGQEQQLAEVKDKASKDALEIQQQFIQQTLIKTNIEQEAEQITRLITTMEGVQSAAKDLKENTETKWKDMKSQMDKFNKDLDGQRQQLVKVKDMESYYALEIQQLKSQLQQQHTLIDTNTAQLSSVKSHLEGVMVKRIAHERETQLMMDKYEAKLNTSPMWTIGQSQMPHDELHSMTLLYQWHITDIKTKDGKWDDDCRVSEVFALTGYDCGAKAIINTDGWIDLQLIDSKKTKTPIDTRSMPRLTWVIESQSQKTQDKQQLTQQHSTHGIRTDFILFKESLDYGKDIYEGCYISSFTRPPYMVSNEMKLKLYVEPPSMARSFFSNNGILLWRMDNYKERKQMEVHGLIWWQESPYFYTSPQGYRVLIRLHLREETVRGRLWFVKGEHDSSLTHPFPHRLAVTLFNHTDQSKNVVISQEGKEAKWTEFVFKTASASLLESGGYVADDSVLIKAVVEAL